MALDESKLENVRRKPGKLTARCPACAERGADRKGEHLVVYEDGGYGCVACKGDTEHQRRIFALAGVGVGGGKAKPTTSLNALSFGPGDLGPPFSFRRDVWSRR